MEECKWRAVVWSCHQSSKLVQWTAPWLAACPRAANPGTEVAFFSPTVPSGHSCPPGLLCLSGEKVALIQEDRNWRVGSLPTQMMFPSVATRGCTKHIFAGSTYKQIKIARFTSRGSITSAQTQEIAV